MGFFLDALWAKNGFYILKSYLESKWYATEESLSGPQA
jgi:hypothetical protein